MNSVSKHMRLSEPTTKIWMNILSYYQERRRSPVTVVAAHTTFMRIFAGVPWRRGIKGQWGNRKRRFLGLSDQTLRLRHLWKWVHRYRTVLVSCRFSTDPRIHDLEWPWNLKWSFYFKFALLRTAFQQLGYISTVEYVYIRTCPAEMCGIGPWSAEYSEFAKNCRSFIDATSSEPWQIRPIYYTGKRIGKISQCLAKM